MHDYKVMPTADFVLETSGHSEFDKDCLWQLFLNLDDLLDEVVPVWVQFLIDFEDRLFNFL